MASTYPTTLDSFATNHQDDTDAKSGADLGLSSTTGVHATHHNDLADAVNKVEAELGTAPSGSFVDVAARLNARLTCRKTADQTHNSTTLTNVTDLSLPVSTTGVDYWFQFFIPWSTASAGVVSQFAITVPAVAGYVVYWSQSVGATTLPTTGGINVTWDETANASADAGAYVGGTSIPAANVITVTQITGILSNPSATGNIQVQIKVETGTTVQTVKRGAYGELYIG